ncbi:MAG: thiamine-phosphate kinase [Candidatus Bathyarchaeia archaeon]
MRKIEEIGEKKAIEIIWDCLDIMPNTPVPLGDDVSAIEFEKNKLAVVKVDMLVGKTDVPPGMSLRQAARKAVVMNVSDFASKGVKPLIVLSSIGLPKNFTEEDIEQIGLGLNEGAREYEAFLVGGDMNEASEIIIDCALLGFCNKNILVKRSGAKPGDLVAVTGCFGKTSSGLMILLENLSVPEEVRKPLIEAVLLPQARLKEGLTLAESKVLSASIDSSDGLAWSLYELSDASNVGFLIDKVPVAPEVEEFSKKYGLDPLELSLYGGEEYELVVTVKPELWRKAKKAMEKLGASLTVIGKVVEEKTVELKKNEEIIHIKRRGWEHFKT